MNCNEQKLARCLVYMLKDKKFKSLAEVDVLLLALAVFIKAQSIEGTKKIKIIKGCQT